MKKVLGLILNIITMVVLFWSIIYSALIFMILEFGINDAIALIDHRGLINYSILVVCVASIGVLVNTMNKISKNK